MTIPNTKKHIKDNAEYVTVSPGGNIPDSTKNVQEVLESIGSYAYSNPGLPRATTSVEGIARIATDADVMDGIGTNTIVTPSALNKRLEHPEATTTQLGLTRYATNTEALAGALNNRAIVASSLKYVLDKTSATESRAGLAKISTNIQAQAGTDDTTIMTPKKVAHAIKMLSPSEGIATEKSTGVVILATTAQAQNGMSREGMAISPYTFVNSKATTTKVGTVRCATVVEATNGNLDVGVAITPKSFSLARASTKNVGTTRIASEDEVKIGLDDSIAVSPSSIRFALDNIDALKRGIRKLETDKISGGDIVHSMGTSKEDVMSQDSVSSLINGILSRDTKLEKNGYYRDKVSGLLFQWGTVGWFSRGVEHADVTFPIKFEKLLHLMVSHNSYRFNAGVKTQNLYGFTATSGQVWTSSTGKGAIQWIAIGV